MQSRLRVCLIALTSLALVASGAVIAANGYDISSPDATSTPERTVELQGESHDVSATITADVGEQVSVDVTAPDEVYRVYLYNSDEQILDSHRGEDDGTFTFDLTGYDSGSYVITTYSRDTGQHEAILPVLIRGYDVETSAPGTVDTGEEFDVSIDVSATGSSGDPHLVKAVIADSTSELTAEAAGSGGQYVATVDASDLTPGDYRVYGIVQGSDQAFGRNLLLGLDETSSLTVQQDDETVTEPGGGGGGGGAGGPGGSDTPTPTATATDTQPSPTPTASTPITNDSTESTPTVTDASSPTPTTTDGAITPGSETTTPAPTTGADGPGFSALLALLAVGSLTGLLGLRVRGRDPE